MKRSLIIGILLLLPTLIINIPEYKELNNLVIVKEIEVKCNDKKYNVKLKEIIPEKEDNGIKYKYKDYEETGTSLKEIKKELEKNTNKKFYYRRTNYLITNCSNEEDILKTFNIKKKKD